ncbi:grpE [Symbiodinium pilosum]|uniref:GrpE protein n=1 Tax=Symbiodinium pilosum TaxID=2952 RepID=A0A812RSE0_SYMPI|nr:grpE [Symbiodinium pilosum]
MCRTIILLVLAAGAEAVKALKGTRLASNVALNRTFDSPVPKDVSDLETTVHELLQQDATPSLANFAKQLEKIIEDEMMAAVKKVKASLQTELDGHYASGYDKCDTSMQGSTEVSTKSSTFSSAASQHSTCRKEEGEAETAKSTCDKEEADLLSEKEKLCKVVSDYNAINNGNCAKQSGETYVTYTRRLKEFYEAEEKKGIAAEEACKKATASYLEIFGT